MRLGLAVVLMAGAIAVADANAGQAQTGELVVTPSSGPVGTVVQISGTGCTYPGDTTALVFQGAHYFSGTLGSVFMPNIPTDSGGHFSTTFTIPATLDTLQGFGGGPVVPGEYAFSSKPPYCQTRFTVTGPGLPRTGGDPVSSSAGQALVLSAFGLAIVLGGALVVRWAMPR